MVQDASAAPDAPVVPGLGGPVESVVPEAPPPPPKPEPAVEILIVYVDEEGGYRWKRMDNYDGTNTAESEGNFETSEEAISDAFANNADMETVEAHGQVVGRSIEEA